MLNGKLTVFFHVYGVYPDAHRYVHMRLRQSRTRGGLMFEDLALLHSQEFVEGKRDGGEEAARQKPPGTAQGQHP